MGMLINNKIYVINFTITQKLLHLFHNLGTLYNAPKIYSLRSMKEDLEQQI